MDFGILVNYPNKNVIGRFHESLFSCTNFALILQASDHGIPRQSSTANVTVHVLDVNDNSPKFSQSQYTANVSENQHDIEVKYRFAIISITTSNI